MISAGWSMGSQTVVQALVEPAIGSVRIPDERMGFVRVAIRVPRQGGQQRVPTQGNRHHARVNGRGIGRACLRGDARGTFPPPPYHQRWGSPPQFFLPFPATL
jgi:hypothetical protein